ncbi:hypothetical protein MTO96_018882 [Rhipicephalus appendiculatus]
MRKVIAGLNTAEASEASTCSISLHDLTQPAVSEGQAGQEIASITVTAISDVTRLLGRECAASYLLGASPKAATRRFPPTRWKARRSKSFTSVFRGSRRQKEQET